MNPQIARPSAIRPSAALRPRAGVALLFFVLFVGGPSRVPASEPQSAAPPASSASAAQDLFAEAQKLLREGNVGAALVEAQAGLKLAPRSVDGLNLTGLIYGQKRDFDRAIAALQTALKIDPRSAVTHTNLGNIYFEEHRLDLAEKEFQATLREHPDDRDANYNLGSLLMAKKQPRLATAYFSRVKPQDPQVLLNLCQAYFASGQKAKGLEFANSLSELAKDDVHTHIALGVLLAAQEEYASEIHEFEAADALQPGTFEILHDLGQAYLKSGDNVRALEALNRALKLQPDSAETLYLMAQAYSNDGKDASALDLLIKAHKLAPGNTDVIFLMARLSMKQSFYADAIPLLEEGVKIAPRRANLLAALGECYFMAGKPTEARQTFQTLLQVEPTANSYSFMGLWYRHQGQFDEAAKYFELGLKADPHDAACLYNLGYIATRQGRYDAGERLLKRALEIQPSYADALLELANLEMDQKNFEEALPLLRKCAPLASDQAAVYYKLAKVERALHQTEAAERDLKIFQTLSKDPQPEPYPYQHLFDYVDQRAGLAPRQKTELDIEQLEQETKLHSENPQNFYLLAEACFKVGKAEEARQAVAQLDKLSEGDFRTSVGVGVLLARYGLYPEAVAHFQQALQSSPGSDDASYDLADAYFRMHDYRSALEAAQHLSPQGRSDPASVALLADLDAHLGQTDEAVKLYRKEIGENPDRDEAYLSLAMVYLRSGSTSAARDTLQQGLVRVPDSGQLLWGMGVVSAAQGNAGSAERYLKRSVDLLPQWAGGYSALGVLYYQTGQLDKARETLQQFRQNGPRGALDASRIEQALSAAPPQPSGSSAQELAPQARQQFLQFALMLADQSP
jgi:tetratricopeptide (TPR) repeat protein